jgi:hypothetical protein
MFLNCNDKSRGKVSGEQEFILDSDLRNRFTDNAKQFWKKSTFEHINRKIFAGLNSNTVPLKMLPRVLAKPSPATARCNFRHTPSPTRIT